MMKMREAPAQQSANWLGERESCEVVRDEWGDANEEDGDEKEKARDTFFDPISLIARVMEPVWQIYCVVTHLSVILTFSISDRQVFFDPQAWQSAFLSRQMVLVLNLYTNAFHFHSYASLTDN